MDGSGRGRRADQPFHIPLDKPASGKGIARIDVVSEGSEQESGGSLMLTAITAEKPATP